MIIMANCVSRAIVVKYRCHGSLSPAPLMPECALRGHRQQENKIFNCKDSPGFTPCIDQYLYNQVTNEQEIVGLKRIYIFLLESLKHHLFFDLFTFN